MLTYLWNLLFLSDGAFLTNRDLLTFSVKSNEFETDL